MMIVLVAGLALWIGVHCVPMRVQARQGLIDRFGKKTYKLSFSLISVLALGLIIWGKGNAEFIPIWQPFDWLRYATVMLMFPAVVLVVAAYGPDNSIRRILGHPMILGVELWAIAHLLVNGDLASILLFGAFLIWALAAFASASRRKPPHGGRAKGRNDFFVAIIAVVVYLGFIRGHQWIAGVALISP